MANFAEFKKLVKKKGYGSFQFNNINGEPVYLSKGIREYFLDDADHSQKIYDVVGCFQKGDFGSAVLCGKEERAGHEYGRYEIAQFDDTEDDTAVWVHRTEHAIKVYFKFER